MDIALPTQRERATAALLGSVAGDAGACTFSHFAHAHSIIPVPAVIIVYQLER